MLDPSTAERQAFNDLVYFRLDQAISELYRRQDDAKLKEYVESNLSKGLPRIMREKLSIVLFRHIATSNFEINRFAMIADALSDFQPLILEYTDDKFNDRNDWKYSLGKLRFYKGMNKNGEAMFESIRIINFNESNNRMMSLILTQWNERLVDFHHRLFIHRFPHLERNIFDLSQWLHQIGPTAKEYYKAFFSLFLRDAILFENFMPDGKELSFTQSIILPTLREIQEECGTRPLIVALEPTDIEGDNFWLSHPFEMQKLLERPWP